MEVQYGASLGPVGSRLMFHCAPRPASVLSRPLHAKVPLPAGQEAVPDPACILDAPCGSQRDMP